MQTIREITNIIADQMALKNLAQIYEDIAVFNMQSIRKQVLDTRQFLNGVSEIYTLAKAAYLTQIPTTLGGRANRAELSFLLRNEKTVLVLISGNEPLLGNLILETYKVFLTLASKLTCDLVICGQIGSYLASHGRPPLTFKYFELSDFKIAEQEASELSSYISQYAKILVCFPRFDSVLVQVPAVDDISGGVSLEHSRTTGKKYFFEPSAREVMSYFEKQIIKLLLSQKLLEAMLARFAARLTVLDRASQILEKQIAKNRFLFTKLVRRNANSDLLSAFAGISLWGKNE